MSDITDRARELRASIEALYASGKLCPNCLDQGWYVGGSADDPEQVQCEFCYAEENSLFNIREKTNTLIASALQRERDEAARGSLEELSAVKAERDGLKALYDKACEMIGQDKIGHLRAAIQGDQPKDARDETGGETARETKMRQALERILMLDESKGGIMQIMARRALASSTRASKEELR